MTSVMKNPANASKKLSALLRKLGSGSPPRDLPPADDPELASSGVIRL